MSSSRWYDWTEADVDIKAGMPDCLVARKHGMTRATVMFHRQRVLKLPSPNPQGRRMNHVNYNWEAVEADKKAGKSNTEIMGKHGMARSTLIRHRKEAIPERKPTVLELSPATILERKRRAMGIPKEEFKVWMSKQDPLSAFSQFCKEARC